MKTETSTPISTTHISTTTHRTSTHSTTTNRTTTLRTTTQRTTTQRTTTHSTTTRKSTPDGNVVLITGGYGYNSNNRAELNATLHSAEIFRPNDPSNPCILPELPFPYYAHTQDGGMICGGARGTSDNCRQWNSKEGKFPKKPDHEFKPSRYWHVSWTPVSEKETFLIGGSNNEAKNSSTVVKPGEPAGKNGFKLKYPLNGACSIPDPETDTVLITGGNSLPINLQYKITSLYNEDKFVENLGNLNYKRRYHGCTSYVTNKKRV